MSETAEQAYRRNHLAVQETMVELAAMLKLHADVAADHPDSWAMVGDLAELNAQLARALAFIDPSSEEE